MSTATLHENMRAVRVRANVRTADIALLCGVSLTTVRRWERGERKPTDAQIAAWAKVCRCAVETLWDGEGLEPDRSGWLPGASGARAEVADAKARAEAYRIQRDEARAERDAIRDVLNATPPANPDFRHLVALALADTVRDANANGWRLPPSLMDVLDVVVGVERA